MNDPKTRSLAGNALSVLTTLAMLAFVVAGLSVAREILIPIALAALLTFLLAPLVTRLERHIGRALAVILVVMLLCAGGLWAAWTIAGQFFDLAKKLPDYRGNIAAKVRALPLGKSKTFAEFSKMLDDLKKEIPAEGGAGAAAKKPEAPGGDKDQPPANKDQPPANKDQPQTNKDQPPAEKDASLGKGEKPVPVKVVETPAFSPWEQATAMMSQVFSPLGTAALVLLLLICMLLQREDLRNRVIRMVGQGHINATTRAMEDAARRVSKYLVMQFAMNTLYGVLVAVGLYFIGIPNAVLWGGFTALLRYVPYVGVWIAAAVPLVLSLAVSQGWTTPALTLGLFVALEILCANLMEPLVYGSSTGVSSIALILAALFWTWIWGPAGLVLSTPLTVCLVVMGRHVPKLEFLSILLSDEPALTPAEDLYHRFLAPGDRDEIAVVDSYLKEHSITSLYDTVFIPVALAAESDAQRNVLEPEHLEQVEEGLRNTLLELDERPLNFSEAEARAKDESTPPPPFPACRVLCLPAHSDRDALAAMMLAHLLRLQACEASSASGDLVVSEKLEAVKNIQPDVVCISVLSQTTVGHARYLCLKVRKQFPGVKMVVGLWGSGEELADTAGRLKDAGADEVVSSLVDAMAAIRKITPRIEDAMMAAPVPANEKARLAALYELDLLDRKPAGKVERLEKEMASEFEMPMVMTTLVDRERMFFLSQVGLPDDLVEAKEAPRDVSVCGHLVAADEMVVVEDLARDRRFANNPWLRQHQMRFYAGTPLRTRDGLPIGSLCLMDHRPREFNERDKQMLQEYADKMTKALEVLPEDVTTEEVAAA